MDPIKEAMIRDEDENGPLEERGKCPDCGGLINDDGYTIDPERACFYCRAD
jgi:hypothetical protein